MKIQGITPKYTSFQAKKRNNIEPQNTTSKLYIPKVLKYPLIASMFIIPVSGGITSCSSDKKQDSQGTEYVDQKADLKFRDCFIDSIYQDNHKVSRGENLYLIAKQHNISLLRLKKLNGFGDLVAIYPNEIIKIPPIIKVKNINNISDISNLTGLSKNYLENLEKIENPDDIRTIFNDRNGNPTVGIGHLLSQEEIPLYQGREISDSEKYTIFAQDLINKDANLRCILDSKVYDNLPQQLRESVFDFVFHRGEDAFAGNKKLLEGLNNKNYAQAVSNLARNYSVLTNAKGEKVERHLSGLCKRSLIRMGNASKIFTKGIPDEVLLSAQNTYQEGLRLLKEENERGDFPKGAYENILTEYKQIAYDLFGGKIGETSSISASVTPKPNKQIAAPVQPKPVIKGHIPVYVNGSKISRTKEEIEANWENTAQRYKRPFKRPELVLDANGNVSAFIKEFAPKKSGKLSGYTIIVNQGHGGCAAYSDSPNNTIFDPGASNDYMEPIMGKNGKFERDKNGAIKLREMNKFIGNGGRALEEWKVNENFSKDLIEKLINSGAKVVFISGEVHNAQNMIRKYEKNHKVDLFISLHSNSVLGIKTKRGKNGKEFVTERITPRGFFIEGNIRGGKEDVADLKLAQKIHDRFQQDSWLVGLGEVKKQSLGVLSSSSSRTSPVPGVLIETGNLKNETDVSNLNSSDFRKRLINATYEGIVDYLTKR